MSIIVIKIPKISDYIVYTIIIMSSSECSECAIPGKTSPLLCM